MLTEYNRWANQRIMADCKDAYNQELQQGAVSDGPSVVSSLHQALVKDLVWLAWLNGYNPDNTSAPKQNLDWLSFQEERQSADERLMAFTDAITERQLALGLVQMLKAEVMDIDPSVGLTLVHLFHQQSHHRAKVQTLLGQMGISTGDLAFLTFQRVTGLGLKKSGRSNR